MYLKGLGSRLFITSAIISQIALFSINRAVAGVYPPASPTPAYFQSPIHSIDAGYGPLSLASGEVRIDGLVTTDVESAASLFSMDVCEYAAGLTSRTWLTDTRTKSVVTTAATRFFVFGNPSTQISLHPTAASPFHVTVIGVDQGRGKPVDASVVWIERVTPAETEFVDSQPIESALSMTSLPAAKSTHSVAPEAAVTVTHPDVSTNGQSYPAVLVRIKLGKVHVRVGLAYGEVGATQSLASIAESYGAIAAINGSFFDCYDSGPEKMPDMEVISSGEPLYKARLGTLIGFTPTGQCVMDLCTIADTLHCLDPAYPDDWASVPTGNALIWQQVTEAIGAGPRLVRDGAIALSPYTEGFSSSEVLFTVARRSAVGYTSTGDLLLVSTISSIPNLARIMKALGCAQAMNLDGGASSGLWVHGSYLLRPGRCLSNALLILPRSTD